MPGRRTVKFATDLGRTELEKGTVSFSFELERGKKEKKKKKEKENLYTRLIFQPAATELSVL